jgi:hypothetical protein
MVNHITGIKMENKNLALEYTNSLIFELEKAFYDERGKGARFRMTTVGSKFYKEKCQPVIKSKDISGMIAVIEKVLQDAGIVARIEPGIEDRLLRVGIHGCLHRPVEEAMVSHGVEPLTCIPANLIVRAIEENLNRPVEIADIKLQDGICQLLLVLFDQHS